MTVTNEFVARITTKWRQHAPHLWWGDRLDARFLVTDAVHSLAGVRVLDIGCNAGIILSEVPTTNHRFGLDRSAAAIELARKLNPSVPLVTGDMLALPYRDASVDAVIYCGMLELPSDERKADAVRETARVLAPGGRLYLTTVNRRHRRYRSTSSSIRAVTQEQLQALLSPHFDFTIRGFNPFPPFPYFLPNAMLARVPGIWRLLVGLMERNVATKTSCMFVVEGIRKSTNGRAAVGRPWSAC
jgi:SAM-dependent methyltransferase